MIDDEVDKEFDVKINSKPIVSEVSKEEVSFEDRKKKVLSKMVWIVN